MARGHNIRPCGSRGDQVSIGEFAVRLKDGRVRAGGHNRLLMIEEELGQLLPDWGKLTTKAGGTGGSSRRCGMITFEPIKFLFVGTHGSVR